VKGIGLAWLLTVKRKRKESQGGDTKNSAHKFDHSLSSRPAYRKTLGRWNIFGPESAESDRFSRCMHWI